MGTSETVVDQARKLLGILSGYADKLPRDKKFTIGDRIIIISLELLETVVEAYYGERKIKVEKINRANIKLEILRQILRFLFESGAHDLKKHEDFNREINIIGTSIGAWRKQIIGHDP
jgi:hypothetical protein